MSLGYYHRLILVAPRAVVWTLLAAFYLVLALRWRPNSLASASRWRGLTSPPATRCSSPTRAAPSTTSGLYIGDGRFLNAPRTGEDVRIDSLSEPYFAARYAGARRYGGSDAAMRAYARTLPALGG